MLDVLAEEWAAGTNRFAGEGEALFGAFGADAALVGIGGVTRDPWVAALRMRRFYVLPAARRDGAGRGLAAAALGHARRSEAGLLRLRAPADAFAFWERLGFVPIPGDPQATHAMVLGPER